MLKAGDKAPAVIGASYDGKRYDLGAPGRRTVLWFYPEAGTSGWTTEAVEFNGLLGEFAALDVQVIGASIDSAEKNAAWAAKHSLLMPLLSDTGDRAVAEAFGVSRPLVGVAKRTTWLIDPDGTLRKVYPAVKPKGHAAEVLAAAREIWR